MEKARYKKNKNHIVEKVRRIITGILIVLCTSAFSIELYKIYNNIETYESPVNNEILVKKMQTQIQTEDETQNVVEMIEKITQSVVGISKLQNRGNSIFLKDGAELLGLGTGVIVSENGYIVTNQHVSGDKYSNCYVTLENGKTYTANVLWADKNIDLSIIKINAQGLNYIQLGDSDTAKAGQTVYAIGNPIGFEFQRTVTSGIISAVNRTIKLEEETSTYMEELIQTDATINPGSSGGPLINTLGQMIGINSVKITSAEGIGFAVPINIIKPIINKYIKENSFEEATIGIFAYDKEVIPYLDSTLEFDTGIYVVDITIGGPTYNTNLKTGDIITKIDNIELNRMSDLREYIYTKEPNEKVILTVLRKNKTSNIEITLGRKT